MSQLRWWVVRCSGSLGSYGVVAVALFFASLTFGIAVLYPVWQQVENLKRTSPQERERQYRLVQARLVAEATPARQYAEFTRFFDSGDSLSDQFMRLYNAAEGAGVLLRQGDYRLIASKDAPLEEFQISLPISAPYPAIRKFIVGVLETVPAAALDQVSFQRKKVGDPMVDADIRFTLYTPVEN